MAFESNNPSGMNLTIDAGSEDGGAGEGLRPKALMLSSLAGCSGLDVASLIRKMKFLDCAGCALQWLCNSEMHPRIAE